MKRSNSLSPNGDVTDAKRERPTELNESLEEDDENILQTEFERIFGTSAGETPSIHTDGPIYPKLEDSFILPNGAQDEDDEYHPMNNPNGIVPVVVAEELVNGLNPLQPQSLTDEQKDGILFMWKCVQLTAKGGVLAHDMGLGKTRVGVTLLATLCQQSANSHGKSTPGIRKCIIVAPKNAITVWDSEFKKWLPSDLPCKVQILRPLQKDGWELVNNFQNDDHHVLILSYESFQKYNTRYEEGFKSYAESSIDLVLCDEAHILKNKDTQRYKSLSSFKAAKLRFGLTGTPFQNSVEEYGNLAMFFRPGIFHGRNFKTEYCNLINKALKKGELVDGEAKTQLISLRNILQPIFHYRTNQFNIEKHDVTLCIPLYGHPKVYSKKNKLIQLQHTMYQQLSTILAESDVPSFEKLSYFHKCCIHPSVLRRAMDKRPEVFQSLIDYYDTVVGPFKSNPKFNKVFPQFSSKISVVAKMAWYLRTHKPSEKMIIVSNSTVLLDLVKDFLKQALGIETLVYDGRTSERDRDEHIRQFQNEDKIQFLLLSLKAGGTALTLTRANHLVLMDPDYNPANDKQALARIYRPSQERIVFIYRLVLTGTIEESKYILQLGKLDIKRFLESMTVQDVQVPFKEKELWSYDDKTDSSIRKLLTELDEDRDANSSGFENNDYGFAEEIRESRQYTKLDDIPLQLELVREVFPAFASYAFHIPKVPGVLERFVYSADQDI